MKLSVLRTDVTPYLDSGEKPVLILSRTSDIDLATWYVPLKPISTTDPTAWVTTSIGHEVRIPLFSYSTADDTAETLYALAFHLGAQASLSLPFSASAEDSLFLAVGNVFKKPEGNLQFWLGVGFKRFN